MQYEKWMHYIIICNCKKFFSHDSNPDAIKKKTQKEIRNYITKSPWAVKIQRTN